MSKYNAEGYPDPTAAEAIANVMKKKQPYVFICSPFAGDTKKNTDKAKRYMKFAVEQEVVPFAPHLLYPQVLDDQDPDQRKMGLLFGLMWLRKCDELWVFGRNISRGMRTEIARAKQYGIKIRYYSADCEELLQVNKIEVVRDEE